jgi:hypothetical protein
MVEVDSFYLSQRRKVAEVRMSGSAVPWAESLARIPLRSYLLRGLCASARDRFGDVNGSLKRATIALKSPERKRREPRQDRPRSRFRLAGTMMRRPSLAGRCVLALGSRESEDRRGSSSAFAKSVAAGAVLAFGETVTTGRSAGAVVGCRTAFDDSCDARRRRRSTSRGQIFDHPPAVFYIHGGWRC